MKNGDVFGQWIVIDDTMDSKAREKKVLCKCSCGKVSAVYVRNLSSGASKSCGHVHQLNFLKHGKTKTRLHEIWLNIRKRCYSPNNTNYPNYGGRGISICKEWGDFETFEKWALDNGYEGLLTIERINVNGNYSPENCTWIPNNEQAKNTRHNIRLEFNGESKILSEWARTLSANYTTIRTRYHKGWKVSEILYGKSK
jgi:hypothetical protein